MSFESELKKGKFVVGECTKCHKVNWPPNHSCSTCFGELTFRAVKEPGIIVEWSGKGDDVFCIVEFEESVRVIGTMYEHSELSPGQKVRIAKCSFDQTPKFTFTVQ